MSEDKIKVTINGVEVETDPGSVLIDVCRENGESIPSFCYYQDLEPQASCRMCLVRIDKMPKLQTSCTIKCSDGMVVTTGSPEIEKAQRAMGEFLLANHPLDCPVCDRGGECELQEVIFDWGDVEERFTEYKNVQPEKFLSPIVANDPQRCILCKRCTRVCSEWMGEDEIEAGNRGVNTVIGTYGGWLNCSQCGNCIEVCPTGTLLDGVYRHATRPWELDQTITTDVYGSDGMQLSMGSRAGEVHRIVARDRYVNGLNGEFLDVKARFAHEFINHPDRIKTPLIRYQKGGKLIPATWDAAIKYVTERFAENTGKVGVVVSPRLTNESIFTLRRFASEVANTDNIAIDDRQSVASFMQNLSAPLATHRDIRYARTILLIGGEPEEEQTYTAKQVRQAVRNGGAGLIIVNDRPIRLTAQAARFIHIDPGAYDAFALAFANGANDSAAAEKLGIDTGELVALRDVIMNTNGDVVVMVGSELSGPAQGAIAAAAGKLAGENRRVLLHPLPLYNNSMGAIDMIPDASSVDEVVSASSALLIAGSLQNSASLAGKDFVVVQELFETDTTEHADVILPAASFAEVDGTFTNNAGNVQRVRRSIEPLYQSKADWMIVGLIAAELGFDLGYGVSASAVFRSIAEAIPAYEGLRYPDLKDESQPIQVRYEVRTDIDTGPLESDLARKVDRLPTGGEKITEVPKIGHKLHRLTTMTSKTPQFHLLAHGNPKPDNLLVSPLEQFELDGTPKEESRAESAAIGVGDRSHIGVNK
ncbi:MAG TPA: molybdopterin-dependent oxidoreductase [Pyrinomonadaceae bacterium]|nr:molybdopterin-dependent oxidoreductase [Pyrinomonadaceae bacterium]HMP64147.1 molybdopterin-dependent oxidoreductase [Pyrinomonadaceae bacterium]